MLKKIRKCLQNSFISTFTSTTTIMILQIVNNDILTDGRNERDYIRRERLC